MKRGNLSKIELDYIKNNLSKDKEQVALDLDRSVKQIEKYWPEPVKVVEKKGPTAAQKRAQETFGKKVKNGKVIATVATTASATLGDETMRKAKKLETHIHKPYGNN